MGVGLEWTRYNFDYDENVTLFGVNVNVDAENDTTVLGATLFVDF